MTEENKVLKFVKDYDGKWYINLPEWKGPRTALQMVAGADKLLDFIAYHDNRVTLEVNEKYMYDYQGYIVKLSKNEEWARIMLQAEEPEHFDDKDFQKEGDTGEYYRAYSETIDIQMLIWLCPVTKFVFDNKYPDILFFKVIID